MGGAVDLPPSLRTSKMANFLARVLRSPVGGSCVIKAHNKAVSM